MNTSIDYYIDKIIDLLVVKRLEHICVASLDMVVDRQWLISWIKAGSPIDSKSPYYRRQILFKHVFKDILKKQSKFKINLNEL